MRIASFSEGAALALDQLRANKTRSALTILGIVIGVATVMAMSALIVGVRTSIMSALEGAGPTNFNIMRWDPFAVRGDGHGPPWGRNPPITIEEANRINQLPKLDGAIPVVDATEDAVYRGHRVTNVRVRGLGAGWTKIFKGKLVQGHNFLPTDVDAAHPVAVISVQLAEELFGSADPVGRRIRIRNQAFDVIGTITLPENIFANQVKYAAVVPFTSTYKYLDAERDFMVVSAQPKAGVPQDEAMDQVTILLRTMRGLRPGEQNNFAFVRSEEMVKTFNKLTGVFFIVMLALSSVGLMVGGVGVIAIMMIAVTERTREIGIRKALGATQREILWQFLFEAVTVTVIGAAIGMILGSAGAFTVAAVSPIPARVPFFAVVAALAMATIAGVVFGLWPAWRAARMDPVVALRYE